VAVLSTSFIPLVFGLLFGLFWSGQHALAAILSGLIGAGLAMVTVDVAGDYLNAWLFDGYSFSYFLEWTQYEITHLLEHRFAPIKSVLFILALGATFYSGSYIGDRIVSRRQRARTPIFLGKLGGWLAGLEEEKREKRIQLLNTWGLAIVTFFDIVLTLTTEIVKLVGGA
jgi:hypothetical protein